MQSTTYITCRATFYGSNVGRALRKLGIPYRYSRRAGGYVVSRSISDPIAFVRAMAELREDIMLVLQTLRVGMEVDAATMDAYRAARANCTAAELCDPVSYRDIFC